MPIERTAENAPQVFKIAQHLQAIAIMNDPEGYCRNQPEKRAEILAALMQKPARIHMETAATLYHNQSIRTKLVELLLDI